MFINFKKYDWEECIRRLKSEILSLQRKSAKHPKEPIKINKTSQINNIENVEKSEEKHPQVEQSKSQIATLGSPNSKLEWKEEDVDCW